MKLCLNINQIDTYLEQADEIKFSTRDYELAKLKIDRYPDKRYIWKINYNEQLNIDNIISLQNLIDNNNLVVEVCSYEQAKQCIDNNIKFALSRVITSYFELHALKDFKPQYFIPGAPLFFEMQNLSTFGIPIRVYPNIAYFDGFPRENGILGTWIAPEHMQYYEPYVDAYEFLGVDLQQEQALTRIYKRGTWNSENDFLITNLNSQGYTALLPKEFAEMRLNCGQKCLTKISPRCKICSNSLKLTDVQGLMDYMRKD